MGERALTGQAASSGIAIGSAHVLAVATSDGATVGAARRPEEGRRAVEALAAASAELGALADRLRAAGSDEQAELVDTAVLIAADPLLHEDVLRRTGEGVQAATALLAAAEAQAELIAAIDDANLALRADDVRSVGRRAARLTQGVAHGDGSEQDGDVILVAEDLGPADVAELGPGVRGIALAHGGVSAHAAIVARSLGLPMVVGVGPSVLEAAGPVALDGDGGVVVLEPGAARIAQARAAVTARDHDHRRWLAERERPAITRDGRRVTVLANVTSPAEVDVALGYGAEGAGLIRSELGFLDAPAWPSAEQHRTSLAPVLAGLGGRTATVRVLDFGGDKTPPFLAGTGERGLALLLGSPGALAAQLRAVLDCGRDTRLRILLPMVESVQEFEAAAALLREAAAAVGVAEPQLGAMIETPRAAAAAAQLATLAGFLSIGTNDLTHATLGTDRYAPGDARPHHPAVLGLIADTVDAAHAAGLAVEVCGEAASDPLCLPLLVGLGVDELSVGAARVGAVRACVRALRHDRVRELARRALGARDVRAVEELVQADDAAAQSLDGGLSIAPIGV